MEQRLCAARGVVVAAAIAEQREISDRSVKESVDVALQGWGAAGCIIITGCVAVERTSTKRGIVHAAGVLKERLETNCSIPCASAEIKQSIFTLCSILPGVTSVGRSCNRQNGKWRGQADQSNRGDTRK